MKYVVSALGMGRVFEFDSRAKALDFMAACFAKMTVEMHEPFVLIETKGA